MFETEQRAASISSVPSLPKGGGAIRGLGESFQANPATGTATLSVPLPFSRARALTPDHALTYDSGAGNSAFGLGWAVAIPVIARKTDKSLPSYDDRADVFLLGGAELVPFLQDGDSPVIEHQAGGRRYAIRRYRPRIEGGFDRIECWRDRQTGVSHWRVWSGADTVSVFGLSEDARVADPAAPARVFAWHLERVFDAFGNLTLYDYVRDDDRGVSDVETARSPPAGSRPAQIYPRRIFYGNRTPYTGALPPEGDFCFRTNFDYGETDALADLSRPRPWPVRPDPFSRHRAGFEIRTRRLCTRVVTEHRFPEIGAAWECTAALELEHAPGTGGQMLLTRLRAVGFTRESQSEPYETLAAPPLTLSYTEAVLDTQPRRLRGPDGRAHRLDPGARAVWSDLAGTGLPGLVSERAGDLMFAENLGGGVLADARPLPIGPTLSGLGEALVLDDRLRRGRKQIVAAMAEVSGHYQLEGRDGMTPFRPARTRLTGPPDEADLRPVDLTGDGIPDMLRTDGAHLVWYAADKDGGHGCAQRVSLPVDAWAEPAFLFSDAEGLTFLADMSGDGLLDVVRLGSRSVRYWPNRGHGRFGAEVVMVAPPALATAGALDPTHLRLVDLDGNGLTDILWLGDGRLTVWANQSGNGFAPPRDLGPLVPDTVPANDVTVVDLLGHGTACVSWTGREAGIAAGARVFVDLYRGVKPDLLARVENGFGGRTDLAYRPSTAFAREAAAAGRPWATTLPYPVHCLATVRITDAVTGYELASSYAYHHGHYDPVEREFCGFARVDRFDTETVAGGMTQGPRAFVQPTRLVRTWFHTGAWFDDATLESALEAEYFRGTDTPFGALPPERPGELTDREWGEAQRAMRATVLREETYALDGSDRADVPFTISFGQTRLHRLQPAGTLSGAKVPAVFQVLQRQWVSFALDRTPDDPRVTQEITLDWTAQGQPITKVSITHGRWGGPDTDTPADVAERQRIPLATHAERNLTPPLDPVDVPTPDRLYGGEHHRRLPLGFQASAHELRGLALAPGRLASVAEIEAQIARLPKLANDDHAAPRGRRPLSASRSLFADQTLAGALPLGEAGPLGIVHHEEVLAFADETVAALYGPRVGADDLAAAGYVADPDGSWWAPSGTAIHGDDPGARFFLPLGERDPLGHESRVTLDAHLLLPVGTEDALGNTTRAINDYRRLGPVLTRDANANWSVVRLDALGRPLAAAAMGKVPGVETPTGYEPCQGSTLERPSLAFEYDPTAWVEGRGPARVTTTAYATHGGAGAGPRDGLVTHDYTSGLGHHLMRKRRQVPGPAWRLTAPGQVEMVDTAALPTPAPRWLGNGRRILNNKGQPIRQYEPYFSVTADYEDDAALVETGLSAVPFYDAAGRAVGQLNPDGTWSKLVLGPWRSEAWDAADTCLRDPMADEVLGAHFAGLPSDVFSATWHAARADGTMGAAAARAAEASADHAETPAITHLDAAGRSILSLADNGPFGRVASRTVTDIEGNALSVHDDQGRAVATYRYALLPPPDADTPKPALWQRDLDAGESAVFLDCMGRPLLAWDAMGRRTRAVYDALSRPAEIWFYPGDGTPERRVALAAFGEQAPDAEARNLRGAGWRNWDSAGFAETEAYDFQGNGVRAGRQLLASVEDSPHWPDDAAARAAMLSDETYLSEAEYDALGRTVRAVLPHTEGQARSIQYSFYDSGGVLSRIEAEAAGGPRQVHVAALSHDARGRRQSVVYGNGVATRYEYDPRSHRLARLVTTGPDGTALQDLSYTHDALGNVTEIWDATQPVIHHAGARVEPVARYRYDALSRLVEASGREHAVQAGAPDWQTRASPADGLADHQRLRPYTQFYAYDSVGNILSMRHVAEGFGWTRHYGYTDDGNRLAWTNVGRNEPLGGQSYEHTAAGAMGAIGPALSLTLNAAEQIVSADLGGGGRAHYTYDGAGERVRKRIERVGGAVEERLSLGGIEITRTWVGGRLVERRETMHIADDKGRIALVETTTQARDAAGRSPTRLTRYQLSDHLGSAAVEVDEAGAVLTRTEYHPYGTVAYFSAAQGRALPPKRYRFTGMEHDAETGLQYHGARFYAPWLGRWIAADPAGIADGLNLYVYVGNNPVGGLDPSGLSQVTPEEAARLNRMRQASSATATAATGTQAGVDFASQETFEAAERRVLRAADKSLASAQRVMNQDLLPDATDVNRTVTRSTRGLVARRTAGTTAGLALRSRAATALGTVLRIGGSLPLALATIEFKDGANVPSAGQAEPEQLLSEGTDPELDMEEPAGDVDVDIDADIDTAADTPVPSLLEQNLEMYRGLDTRLTTEQKFQFKDADAVLSYFGLKRISNDAPVLALWQQAAARKMALHRAGVEKGKAGNAYGRFMDKMDSGAPLESGEARQAFNTVRAEFKKLYVEAYPDQPIADVEHVKNLGQFPDLAVDPRNLVVTPSKLTHLMLHMIKSGGDVHKPGNNVVWWIQVYSRMSDRFR